MTVLLVKEDTVTARKTASGINAYLNAQDRSDQAFEQHKTFFDTDAHVDRICAVGDILKDYFGHRPDYYTKRGLNRRNPFETVKMCDVGARLKRATVEDKNTRLYGPLLALGNVEIKPDNGHLIVRVF